MEKIAVQVVTEDPQRYESDIELLRSIPDFNVETVSPLKFMLSSGRDSYHSVALLEFPFVQENEAEFMEVLSRENTSYPLVVVSDEPLRYLQYARNGRFSIVPREPGYSSELPDAIVTAYRFSKSMSEKTVVENRLKEYSQYLETINMILEHDIGDLNQAILTFSELLKNSSAQPDMCIVDSIISQSKAVASLINSFATLARMARGNVEELSMEFRPLLGAVKEGVSRFSAETGVQFNIRNELKEEVSVLADSSFEELFFHTASYVRTINADENNFDVICFDSFTLEDTVSVTITPRGRFSSVFPIHMKHMDDLSELLKGNVDVMSMVILCKRYGAHLSLNASESGGKEYSFVTVSLPCRSGS